MSEMHSSGSMKRVVRLQSIPGEGRLGPREMYDVAHRRAPGPGLARANSLYATTPVDPEKIDLWSSIIGSCIEGFALYGASFHGTAPLPADPHPAEAEALQPEEHFRRGRHRHISLVSSSAEPEVRAAEFEGGAD